MEHGLTAVRSELKRTGLAGGGAQQRFDVSEMNFQRLTSSSTLPSSFIIKHHYISRHKRGLRRGSSHKPLPLSSAMMEASSSSSPKHPMTPSDSAHALRVAQFDLARYNHHSTLLYAVPPTSLPCLDVLVGLYNWVGSQLSEVPGLWQGDDPPGSAVSSSSSRSSNAQSADGLHAVRPT